MFAQAPITCFILSFTVVNILFSSQHYSCPDPEATCSSGLARNGSLDIWKAANSIITITHVFFWLQHLPLMSLMPLPFILPFSATTNMHSMEIQVNTTLNYFSIEKPPVIYIKISLIPPGLTHGYLCHLLTNCHYFFIVLITR